MSEIWRSYATKQGELLAIEQNIVSLPVDPIAVAEALGIRVEALPPSKKGVSGMLVEGGNQFGIMYATYVSNIGFQKFCIAHEIGHYRLPGHYEQLLKNGSHISWGGFVSGDRYELEADHFASGLLMPTYLFDRELEKHESGIEAIEALSKKCETSLIATAIRYAQRTPDPIAVVVSEANNIDYCILSDELRELKGLNWNRKGDPLPRTSTTYRFNQSKSNIKKGGRSEGSTSIMDWFSSDFHYEMYEEVVGLGSYGKSLTVLSLEELPDPEEIEEEEAMRESWTPRFKH